MFLFYFISLGFIFSPALSKLQEKELINRLQQHDRLAVKELFEKYHAGLCLTAYRILQDREEAKDVVQEVFVKLWKNRTGLQIHTSLQAYLKRAVVNTSLNWLEKEKKFSKAELEKADHLPSDSHGVEQEQMAEELALLAERSIQNLPARTKAVFVLIRQEEMSYKEVAEALEISLKAVEKEMMKALRLLREALKEYLPVFVLSGLGELLNIFI